MPSLSIKSSVILGTALSALVSSLPITASDHGSTQTSLEQATIDSATSDPFPGSQASIMTEGTKAEAAHHLAQVKIEFADTKPVDIYVDQGELGQIIKVFDQLGIPLQELKERDTHEDSSDKVTRTIDTEEKQLDSLIKEVKTLTENSKTTNEQLEDIGSRLRFSAEVQSRQFVYIVIAGTSGAMVTFAVTVYYVATGLDRWVPGIVRRVQLFARRQRVTPESRTVQSMEPPTELSNFSRASGS